MFKIKNRSLKIGFRDMIKVQIYTVYNELVYTYLIDLMIFQNIMII